MKHLISTFLIFIGFHSFSQLQYVNSGTTSDLTFVEVSEQYNVCLSGGSSIRRSFDNGTTWSQCGTFSSVPIFQDAVILGTNEYIVCGRLNLGTNRLFKTVNGGTTWTVGYSGNRLNSIDNHLDTILSVGDGGTIIKSVDNGTTWSTIGSGTTENLYNVNFDENLQRWIITGGNLKMISTTSTGGSFSLTNTTNGFSTSRFENGHYIETRVSYGSDYLYSTIIKKFGNTTVDSLYLPIQSVKTFNLPNQDILFRGLNSQLGYYKTATEELFFFNDSIHSSASNYEQTINSFGFGNNFLLAVGNSGSMGKSTSFNGWDLYVPALFTATSTNNCPGDTLTAIAMCNHADSLAWFIDNVFYSSNDSISIIYPANSNSHQLKLVQYYQGNHSFTTQQFTSNHYIFPIYTTTVDTSLCYNQNISFGVQKTGGGSATGVSVRMIRNGQIIYGPSAAPSNTSGYTYLNGGLLNEGDTITLEFFKTTVCGEQKTSYTKIFTVGPNLETSHYFALEDSTICIEVDSIGFDLASPLIGGIYKILDGSSTVLNTTINSFDTTHFQYDPTVFYYGSTEETTNLTMTVTYNGCTKANQPLPPFTIYNTNPFFEFYDLATPTNQTIQIINQIPRDYSFWQVSPIPDILNNTSQNEPIISANTPGSYAITLVNENLYGCKDSLTKFHHVVDELTEETRSICFDSTSVFSTILESVVDAYGNYVEYGYYYFDDWSSSRLIPMIRKLSPDGTELWTVYPFNKTGIVRCADLDLELNTYAAIDISSGSFGPIQVPAGGGKYLVKWNHAGEIVDYHTMIDPFVLDVVVDQENQKIYYVSATKLVELNWDLDVMATTPISTGALQSNAFYVGSFAQSLSGGVYEMSSPKIKLLPDGDIVLIADLQPEFGTCTFGNQTVTADFVGDEMVIAARYSSGNGFVSSNRLMTIRYASNNEPFIKDIDVDVDGNIYFLSNPNTYNDDTQYFGDSTARFIFEGAPNPVPQLYRYHESYIAKLDNSLNFDWVRTTSIREGNINYSAGTNKLYVSGAFRKHMYLSGGDDFYGIDGNRTDIVDSFGVSRYLEYGYLILDTTGTMLTGNVLSTSNTQEFYSAVYRRHKLISSVTHCGELILNFNYLVEWVYQNDPVPLDISIGGQNYTLNETRLFKISDSQCDNVCPAYYLINSDTIVNCVNTPFNGNFAGGGFNSLQVTEYNYQNQIGSNTTVQAANGEFEFDPAFDEGYLVIVNPLNSSQADTLYFESIQSVSLPLMSTYQIGCGDSIVLEIDPSSFSSILWNNTSTTWNQNTLTLSDQNLIVGNQNAFTISGIDSNLCETNHSFNVDYCFDLGITETTESFSVYPNPTTGTLWITSFNGDDLNVRLFSASGQEIVVPIETHDNSLTNIDMETLSSGIYFLEIGTNKETLKQVRIVKN